MTTGLATLPPRCNQALADLYELKIGGTPTPLPSDPLLTPSFPLYLPYLPLSPLTLLPPPLPSPFPRSLPSIFLFLTSPVSSPAVRIFDHFDT